jgi:uncharacterized protein (DUF1800 family)
MTTAPHPAGSAAGTSRRLALGLVAAGGLAATSLGHAAEALGSPVRPTSPVLPESVSDLASSLELNSSDAWHLARRVCPAPTQSIAKSIAKVGTKAWIETQLRWKSIDDSVADGLVKKHLSFATMSGSQVYKASKKQAWIAAKAMSTSRTIRQVFTKRYLYESMVDTMGDHLYISADGKAAEYVAWFDWSVLRKYALGKYSDLLYAAIRHPAMLISLDNQLSTKTAINENLGRELLELHTVGVGNYTEDDVLNSARLLTGHGYDGKKRTYAYTPGDHYVGALTIMGFSDKNTDVAAGPELLKRYLGYLARHKGTATHLARRLATRFVRDDPSDDLVAKLAKVYQDNDTSLAAVMRALLNSSEFADSVGAKWRRPQETMATMVKARRPRTIKVAKNQQLKNVWAITGTVQWLLYLENHQPRLWPVVNGYPDRAPAWMATQALLAHWYSANARVNWGNDSQWTSDYGSWASALGVKKGQVITDVAKKLTSTLTGYTWKQEHLAIVVTRLSDGAKGTTLTSDQVKNNLAPTLHFIFASPYFMLR